MKSKGTIDMSEVMSVHVLMNQAGNYSNVHYECLTINPNYLFLAAYPSPALKAGEKGYFFQVSSTSLHM